MPRTIRQALGERIRRDPELQGLLAHFRAATGLPIEFIDPLGNRDEAARSGSPLCAWLRRDNAGCRECSRFQQTLLQAASADAATMECPAGLCESAVPMRAGGSTLGYLVTGGYASRSPESEATAHAQLRQARVEIAADELRDLLLRAPVVPRERQAALVALLQVVVEHLTAKISDRLAKPGAALPDLVERACTIVHEEYGHALSVPDIAERLGVSEGHLSRCFHRATGLRFVEYIARYRAERARELLRETNRPVTEIAFASGFHSLSQFNRVFRAQFGIKPSESRATAAR